MELLEILNDYKKNFCNEMCCIETEYKEMKFIKVYFSEKDLHHLLGLHKVLTGINATNSIELIKSEKLTKKDIKKYHNYGMIRPRIDNYKFLYEVFFQKSVELCIVEKDITPNTMYLNLIIYKKKAYEDKYLDLRKTKIKNIMWLS